MTKRVVYIPTDTFYVPKQSQTYSDVLTAYALAQLLHTIFQHAQGHTPTARWEIRLEDGGSHYLVRASEPVPAEWVETLPFPGDLAPFVRVSGAKEDNVPTNIYVRDVDEVWERIRQASALRADDEAREAAQQLEDVRPPDDASVVIFLGDWRMQAVKIYNRLVSVWAQSPDHFREHVRAALALYSQPEPDPAVLDGWLASLRAAAQAHGWKLQETASQLLNPHQGKGQNRPKPDALKMDNVRGRPWLEEFLKCVGLWLCTAPRRVVDTQDWKVYVLAPRRLTLADHRRAFAEFHRRLWNERRRDETSLKSDITSVLLFSHTWLGYLEAAHVEEVDTGWPLEALAPERVVAGFHVAQFKLLSRNAYTMVNLSFLNLPPWSGHLHNRADVAAVKALIEEHLDVVRNINERHSDGYTLLGRYRDFLNTNDLNTFGDFAAGYGHYVMQSWQSGQRWVPTFTTQNLGRLIMATNKPLTPIVENEGFRNVAYAIRHSTIIPQSRKARGQDYLYDVRYGLGAELKRKATVRDEFVAALSNFMQSYNQENAQKLENTGQQMRKDLRTSDIEEVVRLVDEYGSEVVANLLVAYGYAREPREEA